MKFKKAVKTMAALAAVAAGIGTAVYLIKDRMEQDGLDEDFDDDFDEDFDDFDEEEADTGCETREYVNIHCTSSSQSQNTDSEDNTDAEQSETDSEDNTDQSDADKDNTDTDQPDAAE